MLSALILGSLFWLPHQEASTQEAENRPATPATPRSGAGRITEPKKVKSVPPKWPDNARRAGLTGRVALECVIDKDGRVQDTKVLDGHRSLAEAAQVAVRKWRYTPTKLEGEAVPVVMTVTVNFKLEEPPRRGDLLEAIHDSDPEVRWAAVRWLGRYRPITGQQKDAIQAAVADSSELVRTAAKEAMENLEAK
jgi:protein TonB